MSKHLSDYKNILFLVNRNLYYRHYGPFIEYLQKVGHHVHLLHDYSHSKEGVKAGYFPALFSVPQFKRKISFIGVYYTNSDIIKFVRSHKIDYIFSVNSYRSYKIEISEIRPCKWIVLQHWADNFQQGVEEVFGCDHFLSYSNHWWDRFVGSDYFRQGNGTADTPKIHHVGHPLNFLYNDLDAKKIKEKYNLHPDKKVLTYLPIGPPNMYEFQKMLQRVWLVRHYSSLPSNLFLNLARKMLSPLIFRSKQTALNEKSVILSIKKFCKSNDYIFVVKSRLKAPLSKYFTDNADTVLYDETFYPPTISELLFVSDITISHFSMATFEAMAMKSYKINIDLEPVFDIFTSHYKTLFGTTWIDDFNTTGMGAIIKGNAFIENFGDSSADAYKFKDKNYTLFMNKYFSGVDDVRFKEEIDGIIEQAN